MFSKDSKNYGRQITKTTLKAQSIVSILLQQFTHLKPKLGKLVGEDSIDQKNFEDIVKICAKIPKNLERNIQINQELEIYQQLNLMIEAFVKSKGKTGKPYALFLLWKNFQEKLINRVQTGIKGKINPSDTNSDNFKLMSFIQDLENVTSTLEVWANQKTRAAQINHRPYNEINQQNNVELIFPKTPKKTLSPDFFTSNRETATSTALISGKMSKHEKKSDFKEMSSHSRIPSDNLLFRASTAKLQRKELKMASRCPSAANLLKDASYQQPMFGVKRSSRQSKQSSMNLPSQNIISHDFSKFKEQKVSKFSKKDSFYLSRNSKNHDSNLNISILEKGFDSESNQKDLLSIEQLQSQNGRSKKKKATIRESIFKSLSPPQGNFDHHKVIRKSQRKRTIFSSRMLSRSKISQPESRQESQEVTPQETMFDIDDQDFKVKQKKKVTYKKVRRSGKYLVQEKDTWVDLSRFAQNKKSVKELQSSRRRKAILPNNNGQFGNFKSTMEVQEQQEQQRKFQFEENVFLAVTDVLKSTKKLKTTQHQTKEKSRPCSFSTILAELSNLVEGNPFKKQQEFGSIFFHQQEKIRESEDEALKDKIRKLMKQRSQCPNIFEMGYKSESNKDAIYNQLHRNECFKGDEDWIQTTNKMNKKLLQKAL